MSEASTETLPTGTWIVGAIVGLLNFVYLFLSQAGGMQWQLIIFYLLMFDASILASFLIFGSLFDEKLHLTKEGTIGIGVAILVGIVIASGMVLIENFFMGSEYQAKFGITLKSGIGTILYTIIIMFLVATSEEVMTRGFLNSIAENYSKSEFEKKITQYALIPLMFSLIHFFVWQSSPVLLFGVFALLFMVLFHFTFGVMMQFVLDYTGSLWACILAHTIYNTLKLTLPIIIAFNS